jgi:hypothetical protein
MHLLFISLMIILEEAPGRPPLALPRHSPLLPVPLAADDSVASSVPRPPATAERPACRLLLPAARRAVGALRHTEASGQNLARGTGGCMSVPKNDRRHHTSARQMRLLAIIEMRILSMAAKKV